MTYTRVGVARDTYRKKTRPLASLSLHSRLCLPIRKGKYNKLILYYSSCFSSFASEERSRLAFLSDVNLRYVCLLASILIEVHMRHCLFFYFSNTIERLEKRVKKSKNIFFFSENLEKKKQKLLKNRKNEVIAKRKERKNKYERNLYYKASYNALSIYRWLAARARDGSCLGVLAKHTRHAVAVARITRSFVTGHLHIRG